MVTFFIEGTPIPQGSKNAYVRGGRAVLVEANKKLKPWRENVAATARQIGHRFPKDTPVKLTALFIFERPKSVKREHMSVKPDLDKLMRALNDGLTDAGVWGDDSRVISMNVRKEYGYPAGVWVSLEGAENDSD